MHNDLNAAAKRRHHLKFRSGIPTVNQTIRIKDMKQNKKHYSGISLTKASVAIGLSAMLCVPAGAMAGGSAAAAVPAQAVQQGQQAKGNVIDETGAPMIGVTVKLVGGNAAGVTDLDGNFAIAAKPGDKIELTYVGYKTATVSVTSAPMKIQMEPDVASLEDVVVIGYGTMKRRDLTGAVSSVKSEDLTLQPVSNVVEALQGKVAGLDITKASGQAGADVTMQLRGTRSFTAKGDPTVIIDGMPGNLATLNPNDIESIEVLKDASSTAVYGSAGANGVIIVTTKSGKEGKAKVNFNAYVGINGWSEVPEVYDAQGFFNLKKLAQQQAGAYIDDASVLGNTNLWEAYQRGESINWADELLQTGIIQNYSVSVSGGTEKTKAYMSLNFTDEQGQYRNDDYKVYSTNIRVDHQVNKWLSTGVNMQGSYVHRNQAYAQLDRGLRQNPIGTLYDEEGNATIETVEGTGNYNLLLNNKGNYRNNSQITRIYVNPYIRVTPFKGFTWESRLNASLVYNKHNQFNGIGTWKYYNDNGAGTTGTNASVTAQVEQTNSTNYKWENILTYNFDINDDHEFTITGVTSWNHDRQEYTYSYADNFTTNTYLWHHLEAGQNQKVQSSYTMSKGFGLVGRINYSYKGKYLASASVRHDGSSRLADDNKWDTFPAFSLGWRISEEKFMEGTRDWLDNLKIRGGWGITGTASIDAYSSWTILEQGFYGLGQSQLPSYKFSQNVANALLGWEKSKNTNIGVDASFFGGRIDMALDWYYTKTEDIIWSRALPITNGGYTSEAYYQTNMNLAETKTSGLELSLNTRNIVKKDFTWTSNLTFTWNKEEITRLATDDAEYISNGDNGLVLMKGEPVNSWYHYKLDGVWKTSEAADAAVFQAQPGDLKIDVPGMIHVSEGVYQKYVEDENGNMVLKTYDANNQYVISGADYQVLGHRNPDWTMGFKNTFTYKGFDLSIYLYWRWGQTIKYDMLADYNPTVGSNFPTYFDFWTQETGDQDHYFPALNSNKDITQYTGYYALSYVDGSFFKIKNITLGYILPQKWAKSIGIENLRVYTTITNPLVIQKSDLLKNYDPEMNGSLDYPLTKQFVFGVNLTF